MSGVEQTQREVHRWLSYGAPQGLVTSARVLQHKSVPVVLIRCAPLRECHNSAVGMALEGCPDLTVRQLTFRAKNNAVLHFVHLLLGWAYEPYEVQKRDIWD